MLASSGGFSIFTGVVTTHMCNFKRGCDCKMPGVSIIVPVDEDIADGRTQVEVGGSVKHLEYE